ncbi:hypothetical protein UPYG_G00252890 [Umbra pygmaea]|uniref:Uncharacterized protein n=1 Tax=Umbra pygmaea TaxID=75934 RepID=A0ABD0W7W2_UMBPY
MKEPDAGLHINGRREKETVTNPNSGKARLVNGWRETLALKAGNATIRTSAHQQGEPPGLGAVTVPQYLME